MNGQDLIQGVIDYFRKEQWRRLLNLLEYPHPKNAHIHAHLDGCLSIDSLDEVLTSYFEMWG